MPNGILAGMLVYPFIKHNRLLHRQLVSALGRAMQSAMEKLSNIASVAKEKMTICKAKVEEQAEKATARTTEQKEVAHERRKAKEARAKMKLHQAKAKHAEEKLSRRTHHVSGQPVKPPVVGTQYHLPVATTTAPAAAVTVPTYPAGGHLPGQKL